MNLIQNLKIVFIVGCQRTGTTMIGNLLGAHPSTFLIDEPNGLYPWIEAVFARQDISKVNSLFKLCCQKGRSNYRNPNVKCNQDGELSKEVTHIILKAPNLTYSADKIAEFFPGQFCIFAYRDIRDVVVSMSKLEWVPMVQNQIRRIQSEPTIAARYSEELCVLTNPLTSLHESHALIGMIKTDLRDTFDHVDINTLEVGYENMVRQSETWVRKFIQHIQLPFTSQLSDHSKIMAGWGPGLTYRRGKINPFSIGQWKTHLTPDQEAEIWAISGQLLTQLGYERYPCEVRTSKLWKSIKSEFKHQPVVATGRGGSGTRLLSIILQHLDVYLGKKTGSTEDSLEWVNLLYKIAIESNRGQPRNNRKNTLWRYVLRETAADMLFSGDWDGEQAWGWKLPESMVCLPEIYDAFDQFKLIHLVRHPVDISLRRTHTTSRTSNLMGKTVLQAAYKHLGWNIRKADTDPDYIRNMASWYFQVGCVVNFGREVLGPQHYLEVRYEDICNNPSEVSNSLAGFLGVRENPNPMNIDIDQHRRRAWKPPDSRADEVWDLCGDLAVELGYLAIDIKAI